MSRARTRCARPGRYEVDFGDPKVLTKLTAMFRKSIQNKITNPEFAFTSRAELGLDNLLHRLQAKIHTGRIKERIDAMEAGEKN